MSIKKPTIRPAALSDIDEIISIGGQVAEFTVNAETANFWPQDILKSAVAAEDAVILVAETTDDLAGFIIASYSVSLKKSTIENIYVKPEFRGQGIASQLLEELLNLLSKKDCQYVATLVPIQSKGAIGLYRLAGFAQGGQFLWFDKILNHNFQK